MELGICLFLFTCLKTELELAHILTGCDVTSKVGTKVNALQVNPAKYLSRFGENDSLLDDVAIGAENYLVKTIQVNTGKVRVSYEQEKNTSTFAANISLVTDAPSSMSFCHSTEHFATEWFIR